MKQVNVKKLVLLNLPYFLLGLFATNLGEAWRLATGADASAKMLSFFSTLPVALGSWWPSLHPLDFLVGLCCGAGLRLAVYLKGKNAKKYRHNVEYGSARWGTHEDIAPYIDPVFQNNVILTQTERLTMTVTNDVERRRYTWLDHWHISLQTGVTMNLKRKARPCVIAERCMKQGFLLSVRGSCMRGSYGTRSPRSTRTGLKWHRSFSEDPAFSWFAATRWMDRSKTISVWQRGSVLPLRLLTAL